VLLAIDTATRVASIALCEGDQVIAHRVLDQHEKHGSLLAPAIAELAVDFSRIDHYAITIGPGSFTGLRIGLALLKGIALVHPRPVLAISTLEVIAERLLDAHAECSHALVLIDARRNEVYAALFSRDAHGVAADPRLPAAAYPIAVVAQKLAGLSGLVAGGDGLQLDLGGSAFARADQSLWSADARTLARIAARRAARGEGVDAVGLEPVYLQLAPGEAALVEAEEKLNPPKG
jgi:tRNA threonylcarbamoyladenosine biosynthesis protein TsaB